VLLHQFPCQTVFLDLWQSMAKSPALIGMPGAALFE
jgi:hypothetical protein